MRGGKRKGSGRKLGSGSGNVKIGKQIYMTAAEWKKFDELKAGSARGKFIAAEILK